MIKNWHYVITGFLQDRATRTRFVGLWLDLRRHHLYDDTAITQLSWNSNWSDEAERIFRLSSHGPPTVRIYGYSWGAGWGAMQLAEHLRRRGVPVRAMVLVDPIYRHPYWLGNWRSLFHWVKIVVPPSVKEVWWFRQKLTWPRGHDLYAEDGTVLHEPVWLDVGHAHMDDQMGVVTKCLEVAAINGDE